MSCGFINNRFDFTYLFDFYKDSGISSVYKEFEKFKKMCGEEIMERLLFRKVIKHYFNKKHIVIEFDEKNKIGFPDAYVRDGHDIYIFEFKDALMSSKASTSYDFEDIKKDIDLKYIENKNGKSKGVSQIINNLKKIDSGCFGDDVYFDKTTFLKKAKVYPVLIYTHSLYTAPGINSYLNKRFDKKLKDEFVDGTLFKVFPLVMISLNCLVENQQFLTKGPMCLKEIIIDYTKKIAARVKKIDGNSSSEQSRSDLINSQITAHLALEDEYKHIFDNWLRKNITSKSSMDLFENMASVK
ncbi:hypothetical protein [Spirosoma utsteinense]|uniref:Uncharacterized protein n=2 Tax=Spirosoma utsteinense TaxID=2585773 RepID=A0ABR6WDH0_9BACT|nr:hypothetical protein [Spirosoma utsteinense]MBC3794609.1 hypothetical protein [Spirosoma utsteinense]